MIEDINNKIIMTIKRRLYFSEGDGHGCQPDESSLPHVGVQTESEVGAQHLDQLLDLHVIRNGHTFTS